MLVKSAWVSVGELGRAFAPGSNSLPISHALAGTKLALHLEGEVDAHYQFDSGTTLAVTISGRGIPTASGAAKYYAAEVRPEVFFVDYIDPARAATTVSLVLDLKEGICTWLRGQLPTGTQITTPLLDRLKAGSDLAGISIECRAGAINNAWSPASKRHESSRDLVGMRVEYTYSPSERYEHVYLNEQRYTWHCLAGAEVGLADTDLCLYRKVADGLYLFSWQEKIVATLGVVLVDLERGQTCGKVFGYGGFAARELANFTVGARITRVSKVNP